MKKFNLFLSKVTSAPLPWVETTDYSQYYFFSTKTLPRETSEAVPQTMSP